MNILDNFYVDETNTIQLNKYKLIVRDYKTVEKTDCTDTTYFVNEADMKEWTEQLIPKHQLLELISKEELDTSAYAWMAGIALKTDNHTKEIEEIASYGSYEAYEASLPESQDAFNMDTDYRLSKIELGI
ncbi:MAG: hypothetical protein ACI4A5_00150 [Hominilimicola sp.]